MRKQTKLVAVLSTAALLAIGASMTSFAATGWAEEDGTWVYYNRDGERATEQWKKSGNNWYYLDGDGEMATDTLIDDGDNYYYVDINGVMASNQWVAIDNEDAGEENEPDHYWYYFQANGKALTNGNNNKVALKTVNGKKYAFDEDGKMLYGWVNKDNAERIDDTNGDGFLEGDYYFGGEDDGAMTVGWLQMDITYEDAVDEKEFAPVFADDEDQSRWFYFQSNGKKLKSDGVDEVKEKTINGKKYAFDQYGAMTAEWSLDIQDTIKDGTRGSYSGASATNKGGYATNSVPAKYAQQWRYFNSVEDGARLSKNWFKVVAAEYLNEDKYNDDEDAWYYADGSGNLYAGEMKTIKGKKYAFQNDGRMVSGLKFIDATSTQGELTVIADDDENYNFDTEDDFLKNSLHWLASGYSCYYFGGGDDGAMRTGKTNVEIDGDKFNFNFGKSGNKKGVGLTEVKDDKFYQAGMQLNAGKDEKYQVVQTVNLSEVVSTATGTGYTKLSDVEEFRSALTGGSGFYDPAGAAASLTNVGDYIYNVVTRPSGITDEAWASMVKEAGITKNIKDLDEVYLIQKETVTNATGPVTEKAYGTKTSDFMLVNTSGKVIDNKSRSKDGNDYYYVTNSKGQITAIYTEN